MRDAVPYRVDDESSYSPDRPVGVGSNQKLGILRRQKCVELSPAAAQLDPVPHRRDKIDGNQATGPVIVAWTDGEVR